MFPLLSPSITPSGIIPHSDGRVSRIPWQARVTLRQASALGVRGRRWLKGFSRLPRPAPALHGESAEGDGEDQPAAQEISIDSIELGKEISDDRFTMPEPAPKVEEEVTETEG